MTESCTTSRDSACCPASRTHASSSSTGAGTGYSWSTRTSSTDSSPASFSTATVELRTARAAPSGSHWPATAHPTLAASLAQDWHNSATNRPLSHTYRMSPVCVTLQVRGLPSPKSGAGQVLLRHLSRTPTPQSQHARGPSPQGGGPLVMLCGGFEIRARPRRNGTAGTGTGLLLAC